MYYVGKLSDQINSNYIAWAIQVAKFTSLSEAQDFASEKRNEDEQAIEKSNFLNNRNDYLGYSYIVHDGEDIL